MWKDYDHPILINEQYRLMEAECVRRQRTMGCVCVSGYKHTCDLQLANCRRLPHDIWSMNLRLRDDERRRQIMYWVIITFALLLLPLVIVLCVT
ncbi:MAG: hypothetical protein Pg6A_19560 [Termitinemataceae bacterium]|nr:MAG: hypothetical protein Pg6A_19560 [Termitinemataceae bacterium]